MDWQRKRADYDDAPWQSDFECARQDLAAVQAREGFQEPPLRATSPHILPHTLDNFRGVVSVQHFLAVGVLNSSDAH